MRLIARIVLVACGLAALPALSACGGASAERAAQGPAKAARLERVRGHAQASEEPHAQASQERRVDTDGDQIPDEEDSCVLQSEDFDAYLDKDGCPELDNDSDGVPDNSDRDNDGRDCRNEPEDPDGWLDDEGCADLDNDRDTLSDRDDPCPMEPGPTNAEPFGCPRKALMLVVPDERPLAIHFERGTVAIKPESIPILDSWIHVLNAKPRLRIEVQGHTDAGGDAARNKALSEARAKAAWAYLISKGIDESRLLYCGYGDERPIASNATDQGRAVNRRVQAVRIATEAACAAPTPGFMPDEVERQRERARERAREWARARARARAN